MMKKILFLLLFLTGILYVEPVRRKYYTILTKKTWGDAQTYCKTYYTDLATIETAEDLNTVLSLMAANGVGTFAWFGLCLNVNTWHWSLGDEPLGTMIKWYGTKPNNLGGHLECAGIDPSGWFDENCVTALPFLCFDDKFSGNDSYIYYSTTLTWRAAQTFCRQNHKDLASSRNETENAALMEKISSSTWFGLYRDTWKYSDQTPVTFNIWLPNKPDNFLGNEYCAYLSGGLANDGPCSAYNLPFICHRVVTGTLKQIRIKVQSEQNMNDPAVQAALLQQMEQNLQRSGMNIMSVRFRKQPDGNVFQKLENDEDADDQNNYKCSVVH